jgi:tetratricopeptide (TPR) repeat protein
MAATQTAYGVVSLGERLAEAEDDRGYVRLREDLDVGAFGVSAIYQRKAGDTIVGEHDEAGPGHDQHEELYAVVQGAAIFTVDGDEVDAPQGTVLFVRDPEAKRKAVATADDTIVLAVGGRHGEAYRLSPAMSAQGFYRAYQSKDYAAALEACNRGLEAYPGNAYLLYNVACMKALLGDREQALAALADSIDKWGAYHELARQDDDFASLREDPRFVELVG